jgi:hypothetical protein
MTFRKPSTILGLPIRRFLPSAASLKWSIGVSPAMRWTEAGEIPARRAISVRLRAALSKIWTSWRFSSPNIFLFPLVSLWIRAHLSGLTPEDCRQQYREANWDSRYELSVRTGGKRFLWLCSPCKATRTSLCFYPSTRHSVYGTVAEVALSPAKLSIWIAVH